MERVLFILESIEKHVDFDIEIEYRVNLDLERNFYHFEARVNQFMGDCPLVVDFKFSVIEQQISNHHIGEFMLPPKLRGQRVSGFILNKVYDLIPEEVKPFAFVNGELTSQDQSPSRDTLFKKLIQFPTSKDSRFIASSDDTSGEFYGRFHDVGDSWKKSLRIKT